MASSNVTPPPPQAKPGRWGVLVIYTDGHEDWMRVGRSGGGPIARHSKPRAEAHADFLRIGMDGDPDIQSINVAIVPAGER